MYVIFLLGTVVTALLGGALLMFRLRHRSPLARLLYGILAAGVVFLGIWLAVIGALLAALFEPWPLSLRQGPDTEFAHECFNRFLLGPPAVDFQQIYCRDEWGFGGDSIRSIRFEFTDRASLDAVLARLRLQPTLDPARPSFRYLRGPHWWPREQALRALPEAYELDGREYLWIDSAAGLVYYQVAGF